jgi:hypothetical protein
MHESSIRNPADVRGGVPSLCHRRPVYPGAKSNEMLTKADGENHPGSVAYTTVDTFESVYEF